MYLGYLDYLDYLDLLDYLDKYYIGIHALNNSNYITLAIGHTKHSGEQRVSSFVSRKIRYRMRWPAAS